MGKAVKAAEKPLGFIKFSQKYATEDACREALYKIRWPDGFVCPRCGCPHACYLENRRRYQCNHCKHQTSPTVGTVMQDSKLPLQKWFWAFYLVTTDKRGISALQLSKQLPTTYKTAWYLMQRIRYAMGKRDEQYLLSGIIEFDDCDFGGRKTNGKPQRGQEKSRVLVAISKTMSGGPLFIKMRVVDDLKGKTIGAFAESGIEPGSVIKCGAAPNYKKAIAEKWLKAYAVADADPKTLQWLNTIVWNLRDFVTGTPHGLDKKYLQYYFNEACYRFNRRKIERHLFDNLCKTVLLAPVLRLDVLKG